MSQTNKAAHFQSPKISTRVVHKIYSLWLCKILGVNNIFVTSCTCGLIHKNYYLRLLIKSYSGLVCGLGSSPDKSSIVSHLEHSTPFSHTFAQTQKPLLGPEAGETFPPGFPYLLLSHSPWLPGAVWTTAAAGGKSG